MKGSPKPSGSPGHANKPNEVAVRTLNLVDKVSSNSHIHPTEMVHAHIIATYKDAEWQKTALRAIQWNEQRHHHASGFPSREWSQSPSVVGCQRSKPDQMLEPSIHKTAPSLSAYQPIFGNDNWWRRTAVPRRHFFDAPNKRRVGIYRINPPQDSARSFRRHPLPCSASNAKSKQQRQGSDLRHFMRHIS